jgi:predicted ribosome quality control (RQC) complex YloA/Tae2 family protein
MVQLTAAHLGELLAELRPLLEGQTVQALEALPPRDLVLVFAAQPGQRRRLLRISASADGPRLHLQQGRFERHPGPIGPFFVRLAGALAGARLIGLDQPRQDRLALLRFETAGGERRALVLELTGRHANLCLLDGSERLLAVLVEAPATPNRAPRLVLGQPWAPPPGQARAGVPGGAEPGLASLLTPLAAGAAAGPADLGQRVEPDPAAPLSLLVERVLGGLVEGADRAREAKALSDRLERRLARARSTQAGLAQRRQAAEGAERVRQDGELLKAALGSLRRGQTSVELADWFADGAPRRIELDQKLSPQENVERVFKRYHKLERSLGELDREAERAGQQLDQLTRLLAELSAGAEPAEIEARSVAAGLLEPLVLERGKRAQAPAPRLPYRRFTGLAGGEILVGRNAKDNDELTFKVARGNDLWLHTADSPGSHVILRQRKDAEAHPEDVLDACHLAAHFSPLSASTRVNIHLAPRKQVHKPRGAPAGLVTLSGGKTRAVRIEPERLARLLENRD